MTEAIIGETEDFNWSNEMGGQFINLRRFTEHRDFWNSEARLPDWRTVRDELPHLIHSQDAPARRLFVTHRWDAPEHPDPSGWQLRALQKLGSHYDYNSRDLCFWYDFMSLPQRRDSNAEKRIFRQGLANIRHTVAICENICLVSRAGENHAEDLAAMRLRGWIVFELYIRRSRKQRPLPLFEREASIVNYGRAQYGWDDVVPDLAAHAPTDTRELLYAWLRNRGITCTNGSDLSRLATFLHEELTRPEHLGPAPEIAFGSPVTLMADEMVQLNIVESNGRSMRLPELYLERTVAFDPKTSRFTVVFRHRPPLPPVGTDLELSAKDLAAMIVDPVTGTSPMYPGVRFVTSLANGCTRVEVV